jgi:hypothetical protein
MRFDVTTDAGGDLAAATRAQMDAGSDAAFRQIAAVHTGAIQDIVKKDVGLLRADIQAGGFVNAVRLSKTWQGRSYPSRGKVSMEPAGYISTNAATIIDAFTLGLTIHAHDAQYLAVPEGPAKAVVRRLNQASNRSRTASGQFADEAGTVQRVAAALGVDRLEARIDKATGRGVLVAAGRRLTRTGRGTKTRGDDTVLFVLVRQATLKTRIQGRALLANLQARAPGDLDDAIVARSV